MHNIKSITKKDRYGNMFSLEMFEDQSVPLMIMVPDMPNGFNGADTDNHPGNPKGTDTVPAWLTPGENVVNAEASRIPGNQEKIDQMNKQGRQMQAAQGGPIPSYAAGGMEVPRPDGMLNSLSNRLGDRNGGPMYAAMGTSQDDYVPYDVPSWFTPEILERLIQTESGNNNQAVNSRSGATGAAQIMADTALDPGYNVQPITLEQRKDPEAARRFATQYISGIQKEHPNFTPAQVLQAYNAGPRRMALNIDGEYFGKKEDSKPLAQETIDYPAKILGEDFIPPRPTSLADQRKLKLQEFNKKAIANNLKIVQDSFNVLENKRQNNIAMGRPEFKGINKTTYNGTKKDLANQQKQLAEVTEEVTATTPKTSDEFVESIIAQTNTDDSSDQPLATQPGDIDAIAKAGLGLKDQDPGFFQQSVSVIKDVLGEMFSSKDIARIAIQYVGSRALGYAHNGSLNYAMKEFATNKKLQQKQEFDLIKANAKNYSVASYNKYLQTRDVDDLKPLDLSGVKKRSGKIYHTQLGTLNIIEKDDGREYVNVPYTDKDGKRKSAYLRLDDERVAPYLEEYNSNIHDDTKVKKSFFDITKTGITGINDALKAKDEDAIIIPAAEAGNISSEMLMLFQRDKKSYGGVSSENQMEIIRNLELAQQQYLADLGAFKNGDRDDKPQSIASYYNTNKLVLDTRGVISATDTVGTDSKNVQKVINKINVNVVKSFPDDKKAAAAYYKNTWAIYKNTWDKYTQLAAAGQLNRYKLRANYINQGDNKNYNDFFAWINDVQNKEKNALEILQRLK